MVFVLFLSAILASAQGAQEILLSTFFGPSGIRDKKAVYIGEMLQYFVSRPTLGQTLPPGASSEYRKLRGDPNAEIWAIVITVNHRSTDWYAYLRRDATTWKLEAVRTLALSGVFFKALDTLSAKERTPSEELTYQNMLLTTKSDVELKNYFLKNKPQFDELIASFRSGNQNRMKSIIEALHLNAVTSFSRNEAITDLSIGGILDNSVGFMYVPKGASPPQMSPNEFIYVEEIADRWYLYKTT